MSAHEEALESVGLHHFQKDSEKNVLKRCHRHQIENFKNEFLSSFESYDLFYFVEVLWLKLLLGGIAAGVTAYLLSIKTLTPKMQEELDRT